MSRRKRLIERDDEGKRLFPTNFAAFQGDPMDPINAAVASTPPEGVENPYGTPHRGAYRPVAPRQI